jgi:hypothetical protein
MGTARAGHAIGDALAPLSRRAGLLGARRPESRLLSLGDWGPPVVLLPRIIPDGGRRWRRAARRRDPPMSMCCACVRNRRLCAKSSVLDKAGNLPVSGTPVLSESSPMKKGRLPTDNLPSNVAGLDGKRESSALLPTLTLLYVIKKSVLKSKLLLQMLITC